MSFIVRNYAEVTKVYGIGFTMTLLLAGFRLICLELIETLAGPILLCF